MATAEHTISPGGLALNADGSLANLSHELAHAINASLLHVVALLQCGRLEIPLDGGDRDDDALHDGASRATALVSVAEEKVREVLRVLSPYV